MKIMDFKFFFQAQKRSFKKCHSEVSVGERALLNKIYGGINTPHKLLDNYHIEECR